MASRICAGPCGKKLPEAAFYRDGTGHKSKCKECYKPDYCAGGKYRGGPRMDDPVARPVKQVTMPEVLSPVEEHRLKAKNAELVQRVKTLTAELSDAQLMAEVIEAAQAVEVDPIKPRERKSGIPEGTAQILASDWHIEEEVKPGQVNGRNRYNLEISSQRMTRFFEASRWALDFSRQAFKVRDVVLWLGGDFITSYLHPDNVETNLLSPPEALAYAHDSITRGIRFLLDDPKIERLVIPCNDGNHGRMSDKMRAANRIPMSLEIMLYGMIAREFSNEQRVKFIIAQGSQIYYDIYDKTVRYTHGDEARYGGGVGGVTIPLMKALARWETIRHADLTVVGHWHQHTSLRDLIINGSLIGMSAYSLSIGARYEPPTQDFTMLSPKRFKGISIPLQVSDAADDDVNQEAA